MAKKKVMLFIVEGPTDETSLSTVLNRIFNSSTVKFQVVHGDILTRDFTASDKIVAAVWEQVKAFMGDIYKRVIFAESFTSPTWMASISLMLPLSMMLRWNQRHRRFIRIRKFRRRMLTAFGIGTSASGITSTGCPPAQRSPASRTVCTTFGICIINRDDVGSLQHQVQRTKPGALDIAAIVVVQSQGLGAFYIAPAFAAAVGA